ncbi:MAG TPA: translational GTPase TypA [Thermoanaerobaculia bacterium]|jgi:GTP-binding protein|nr:translational GTPase TypA [Thermoanaerobaculia bacterium]
MQQFRYDIRNVAIIAHVDHGKTTLVDALLKQAGAIRAYQHLDERVMDSNDLEKERGITILAKNTSVRYLVDQPDALGHPVHHEATHTASGHDLPADFVHPTEVKINIVDTPGHADFGGEVERVLSMVDGVILLVDAAEGPMPQTRFVLRKALGLGLLPIVVINKIDRTDARPTEVVNEVFDLMIELGASDEQLDFPILYAIGRQGIVRAELSDTGEDCRPLFDAVLKRIPPPPGYSEAPLQLLVSAIDYNEYVGRLGVGRVQRGRIRQGNDVILILRDGTHKKGRITKLTVFEGLKRIEVEEASAGEIVAVAGFADVEIGETFTSAETPEALEPIAIDEPTVSMFWLVNDSPFAGTEGKYVTSRNIKDRLDRELRKDVALRVRETGQADRFEVAGRGELHLSILAENMRREGFEFALSRPQVILKNINGQTMEPYEALVVDIEEAHTGTVMEKLQQRRAEMTDMVNPGTGRVRIEFKIPTRGLFGIRTEFLTETRGTGLLYHTFLEYGPYRGELTGRNRGALVAKEAGETTAYAIEPLQERTSLFLGPGVKVYGGQIVGENSRDADMVVQVCRAKHLTNMRASGSDMAVRLTPPRLLTLEQTLEWIEDDELVEVTPESIRIRKMTLDHSKREVAAKKVKKAAAEG